VNKTARCRTLLLSSVLLFLMSCSKEPVPLPDPGQLPLTEPQISALYGVTAPDIALSDSQVQTIKVQQRELSVRLLAPAQPGQYPLLVFSHGNWSDQLQYEPLLQHWAKHGYAILSLNHDDCCGMASGILAALRYGNLKLIEQRVQDIALLLNHPAELDALLPAKVSLDHNTIAITGHSFGAYTAQLFAGATLFDTEQKRQRPVQLLLNKPQAVKAVLAISPPGPMFDEITEQSWQAIDKPMLVTTGTWDVEPRFFPDYKLHLMSHQTAPAGDQYALVIAGADHYYGNLICRPKRDQAPQLAQFKLLQSVSIAFLNSYVKQDPKATEFLQQNQITKATQGFASLFIK
jgi:predicted dienelactone hydrolase